MPPSQQAPLTPASRSTPGPSRRPFFAAAAMLVMGEAMFWTMLAAVQTGSGPAVLDGQVHDVLVGLRSPWATAVLGAVTTVTSPLSMTVGGLALAVGWAVWKREIWRPALLIGAMMATFALSTLIKQQVGRARPPARDFLLGPDDALSFPSGHTFGAGVFLFVLAYLLVSGLTTRTTAVLAYAAAAIGTGAVALSRLYLGYHWLTDVLASIGLAIAVTGLVMLVDGLRAARRPAPAARTVADPVPVERAGGPPADAPTSGAPSADAPTAGAPSADRRRTPLRPDAQRLADHDRSG